MNKYYVGVSATSRIVFWTALEPSHDVNTGAYQYVIGPFRTKGGALVMARYGRNNPHLQHVDDAERMSKRLGARWYRRVGMVPNNTMTAMEVSRDPR